MCFGRSRPRAAPKNLGEVVLNGAVDSKLDVTTDLQAFGLIVTAEPYFSVTTPSDVVVMEKLIRTDTVGKIEEIDAKYELLPRGQYTMNVTPDMRKHAIPDMKRPLEVIEARNAVEIARWAGADKYAADTFQKAAQLLDDAENYQARKHPEKKSGRDDRAGSGANRGRRPIDHAEAAGRRAPREGAPGSRRPGSRRQSAG